MIGRAQKRNDVYAAVFHRLCQLVGSEHDDPDDPLMRDFYETMAAYEQLLTEKSGRNIIATRTRQKLENKGVHLSLVEWTRGKIETNGFTLLIDAGMPESTGEYLVTRYAARFRPDVVQLARERLVIQDVRLRN